MKQLLRLSQLALINVSLFVFAVSLIHFFKYPNKSIVPNLTSADQPSSPSETKTGLPLNSTTSNSTSLGSSNSTESPQSMSESEQNASEAQQQPQTAAETSKASQVSQHSSPNDCWMIIDGHVYDISAYFGSHPGGDPNLLAGCGSDATAAYHSKGKADPKDHSANAMAILEQYRIE